MGRPKHPNKEIEVALNYAESYGWSVEKKAGSAHAWGAMYCPTTCIALLIVKSAGMG